MNKKQQFANCMLLGVVFSLVVGLALAVANSPPQADLQANFAATIGQIATTAATANTAAHFGHQALVNANSKISTTMVLDAKNTGTLAAAMNTIEANNSYTTATAPRRPHLGLGVVINSMTTHTALCMESVNPQITGFRRTSLRL